MKIIWEVTDTYIGKAGPHYLEIDDTDLAGYETEDERDNFITECVQEEFDQVVSFTWQEKK